MIKSMTAYAMAEKDADDFSVYTEIRTYNSKYLDIYLRMPRGYELLEKKIKEIITEKIARGRIEIKIKIKGAGENTPAFEINKEKAAAYQDAVSTLKKSLGLEGNLSLDHFAAAEGIIVPRENDRNVEQMWPHIRDSIDMSVSDIVTMRQNEGEFIAKDFKKRIDDIEAKIDHIEDASSELPVIYRDRLEERITAMTKGMVDIDPNRIAQEAAIIADRSDISEEIVRAKSHVKQFRSILDAPEPAGRKLNFLLQEINREFNTMSSKAANAEMSHIVVAVKAELEKIREQVQNIE